MISGIRPCRSVAARSAPLCAGSWVILSAVSLVLRCPSYLDLRRRHSGGSPGDCDRGEGAVRRAVLSCEPGPIMGDATPPAKDHCVQASLVLVLTSVVEFALFQFSRASGAQSESQSDAARRSSSARTRLLKSARCTGTPTCDHHETSATQSPIAKFPTRPSTVNRIPFQ